MIAGAVVEMGDLSVLWWLLLVPVAVVAAFGAFNIRRLPDGPDGEKRWHFEVWPIAVLCVVLVLWWLVR